MNDTRYPTRMHEVLGVATEERFTHGDYGNREFLLSESGLLYRIFDNGTSIPTTQGELVRFINHPERIIRKPRMSEEQVAQLRACIEWFDLKWLAKQECGTVMAFESKPHKKGIWFVGKGYEAEDYGWVVKENSPICSLVSWSDPEPLDIVATLKAAGVEVE